MGKLIFIRHAIAPGNGDPDSFDLKDCSTQRNLNEKGIKIKSYDPEAMSNAKKENPFLIFCDDNFPSRILLKKDNEFELVDFLVKQSEKYQKILN